MAMDMKKKKGAMPDIEKHAKMSVLHGMRDEANEKMAGNLHNLKKVTVASDSPDGMAAGLEHAKALLGVAKPIGGTDEHPIETPEHEKMEPDTDETLENATGMEMTDGKQPAEHEGEDMHNFSHEDGPFAEHEMAKMPDEHLHAAHKAVMKEKAKRGME